MDGEGPVCSCLGPDGACAQHVLAAVDIADRELAARRTVGGVFLDRGIFGGARRDRGEVVDPDEVVRADARHFNHRVSARQSVGIDIEILTIGPNAVGGISRTRISQGRIAASRQQHVQCGKVDLVTLRAGEVDDAVALSSAKQAARTLGIGQSYVFEEVAAAIALECVRAIVALDHISAVATVDRIIASAAEEHVGAVV